MTQDRVIPRLTKQLLPKTVHSHIPPAFAANFSPLSIVARVMSKLVIPRNTRNTTVWHQIGSITIDPHFHTETRLLTTQCVTV